MPTITIRLGDLVLYESDRNFSAARLRALLDLWELDDKRAIMNRTTSRRNQRKKSR